LDAPALQDAIGRRVPHIVAEGEISGMPMLTLSEGQRLSGGTLRFGASGVRLRRNNVLEEVTIIVPEHERAVVNDASVPDWGRLELRDVRTEGQWLNRGGDRRLNRALHARAPARRPGRRSRTATPRDELPGGQPVEHATVKRQVTADMEVATEPQEQPQRGDRRRVPEVA
jgi:hypothetical protein